MVCTPYLPGYPDKGKLSATRLTMIYYVTGNASRPLRKPALILHVVNDIGAWGAGFTAALDHYPRARASFRQMANLELGSFLAHDIALDVWIGHLLAQRGLRDARHRTPLRYPALAEALQRAARWWSQQAEPMSVHMPRIGCGLAGGSWDKVEPLIQAAFWPETQIYVYDPPAQLGAHS